MAIIRASENDVKRIFELIKNRFGNVNNTADAYKNVASAAKLTTARTIRTNLGSTSTVNFDGTENVTPGVTGTLPISNGGTGATSASEVLTNLGITATAAELNKLDGVTATAAELNYVDGVTSNIQTQLNGKLSSSGNAASATRLATARNINGMSFDGSANRVNYGTCATAAATAAKTVSCTGFTLVTGAEITVKFTATNTAANPTLNVNSTGAHAIYYRGSAISAGYLAANRTYTFRYNGTQYDLVGDVDTNTTYSVFKGATASAAGGSGLVPAPASGENDEYLRGDGTWATPPNTTYSNMGGASSSAAGQSGLVPAPSAGASNRYLRSDGTWAVPPDTNTTYSTGNTTTAGVTKLYTSTGTSTDGTMTRAAITTALDGKADSFDEDGSLADTD